MPFQPLLGPLGFDWKISVSLLFGFVAKEIVVASLGVYIWGW
jgi:ferrous iron transport protein B